MYRRIIRVLHLPLKRKILIMRVSFMLLAVRLGLALFSFSRVYRFLKHFHPADKHAVLRHPGVVDVDAVCWAVTRAGTLWFGDEGCLPQALVGEMLLLRIGIPARMHVGICKEEAGTLLAHAWVEDAQGFVLIGGSTLLSINQFTSFPEIQPLVDQ